jgi:8-oxo-dGTP pyrophosphatase MutT (NUDIX family)
MQKPTVIGQRISAGGIVLQENRLLLVHHFREGQYDFWVMPGGGVQGDEGILRAAEREVWEETNLTVLAERIAYVEDFIDEGKYVVKFWVLCSLQGGTPSIANADVNEEYLRGADFFSREEIQKMDVFPLILKDAFWRDLQEDFPQIRFLGYRNAGK